MKKIFSVLLALCLLAQLPALSARADEPADASQTTAPAFTATDALTDNPQGDGTTHTLDAQTPLGGQDRRLDTAKAALLYEVNTGTMLYFWNPDAPMEPASLVKALTVLLAVEEGDLTEVIRITPQMMQTLATEQLSTALQEDELVTLEDLCAYAMVSSNNAACVLIAMHLYGSEDAFVTRMNARAGELGCTATRFTNSHGIPEDGMRTTARDMARIILHAMENEDFCRLFGLPNYTVAATNLSEERTLKTTNYFLSKQVVQKFYDSRVTGGKSGAASTKDRSVVFTAESDGVKLLGVVMGAEGKTGSGSVLTYHGSFEEASVLLNFGFDSYTTAQLLFPDKSMTQLAVSGASNDVVVSPADSAFSALPADFAVEDLRWEYVLDAPLEAPVLAGEKLGTVQVWAEKLCLAQADMIAMNSAKAPANADVRSGSEGSAARDGAATLLIVLGIVGACAVAVVLAVFLANRVRSAAVRRRRRKRMESRRRNR